MTAIRIASATKGPHTIAVGNGEPVCRITLLEELPIISQVVHFEPARTTFSEVEESFVEGLLSVITSAWSSDAHRERADVSTKVIISGGGLQRVGLRFGPGTLSS